MTTSPDTPPVHAVILAAGMGTRLGRPFPKPLTVLADGRSIMQQQLENLTAVFGPDQLRMIVVGFKLDLILEAFPDEVYVYNEAYDQTNTNRSLLKALRAAPEGGVLWMNGDVVFDPAILEAGRPLMDAGQSFVCVNTASVGEEEVKYTLDDDGRIRELSKTVTGALGESVGINYVAPADRAALIRQLQRCDAQDYFERGIELAIEAEGLAMLPLDVSRFLAIEVDFEEDLTRANSAL